MTQADSIKPAPDSAFSAGIVDDTAPKTFGSETPEDGHSYPCPVRAGRLVGSILSDRYELLALTGIGGMGVVYKGKHIEVDRLVAVKIMHCRLAQEEESVERFRREGKMAGSLSHPNVCGVFDSGRMPKGEPYLVMEYVEGKSLKSYIEENGCVPEDKAIPIFVQICQGLAHAHEKGLIHRDLKPSNVMLADYQSGQVAKVMDFGIAKSVGLESEQAQQLTKTGEVFGSPLYMSPEQCRGTVDHRSDVYSLGCLMYQCLTGIPPLVGNTAFETMFKHMTEMPLGFDKIAPEIKISPALESVVFKAIAKEPEKRYQTMDELGKALQSLSARVPRSPEAAGLQSSAASIKGVDEKREDHMATIQKTASSLEEKRERSSREPTVEEKNDKRAKVIFVAIIVLAIFMLILLSQIMQ